MPVTQQIDEIEKGDIESAYDAVGERLKELSVTDDRFRGVQQLYFNLKAALLARDPEFQEIDLRGDVHVPSSHRRVGDNPTVQDTLGEVELPTRDDHFSVLAGLQVADPNNPHIKHAVHVDTVIEPDGEIRVEINGTALSELPGSDLE